MIALFCRLYKTKRMQHMSCILLFCIYIPHYSNYLSIFIRYTPTQTEGHIPCLRHQQLYFSDSPVLFPALHLDSPAGTLLQLHLLWGPHRRILSDLHNFRLRLQNVHPCQEDFSVILHPAFSDVICVRGRHFGSTSPSVSASVSNSLCQSDRFSPVFAFSSST